MPLVPELSGMARVRAAINDYVHGADDLQSLLANPSPARDRAM